MSVLHRLFPAVAVLALMGPPTADAQGNAESGKTLYTTTCASCHGAQGQGVPFFHAPALSGLDSPYLTRQINGFRHETRGRGTGDSFGALMVPMAKRLPGDQGVADLVAYIETLPLPSPPISATGDAASGKKAYRSCATCHGQNAEGIEAMNSPALIYQDAAYLELQLTNFSNGARGANASDTYGAQMAPMAKVLADEKAIKDVVAYIESLRPSQGEPQKKGE